MAVVVGPYQPLKCPTVEDRFPPRSSPILVMIFGDSSYSVNLYDNVFSRTSDGVGSQLGSDPQRRAGSLLPSGGGTSGGGGASVPFQVQLKVKAALLSLGKAVPGFGKPVWVGWSWYAGRDQNWYTLRPYNMSWEMEMDRTPGRRGGCRIIVLLLLAGLAC